MDHDATFVVCFGYSGLKPRVESQDAIADAFPLSFHLKIDSLMFFGLYSLSLALNTEEFQYNMSKFNLPKYTSNSKHSRACGSGLERFDVGLVIW